MDKGLVDSGVVQFGKTAADYATYRPGFPASFFERLFSQDIARKGMQVLDLGTGTGTLARGFAARGCVSTGIDPSRELLGQAEKLAAEEGLDTTWVQASAEDLPFEENTFDLVTAGQCWHWFDHDVAAKEIARVLKPGGILIIANFDWRPDGQNIAQQTLDLIPKYNPEFTPKTRPGFFMVKPEQHTIPDPLGFKGSDFDIYVEDVPFSHASWRGRVRASSAIGASNLETTAVEAFDKALADLLRSEAPSEPVQIPHYVVTRIYRSQG